MILLRAFLFQALFYGFTAVAAISFLPLLAFPPRAVLWLARSWSRVSLWLLERAVGLGYALKGLENLPDGPAIYAIKHQSAWDTLFVSVFVRDPAICVKRQLFFIPIFGWYMRKAGQIEVPRGTGAGVGALYGMVASARRALAAGRPVVVFPEGTRTPPGARVRYQSGVAAFYRELGVPVVPVALNSGLFWARRKFLKRPGRITVRVLPPIEPGLARKPFMTLLEDRIETATAALVADAIREFDLPRLSPAEPPDVPVDGGEY